MDAEQAARAVRDSPKVTRRGRRSERLGVRREGLLLWGRRERRGRGRGGLVPPRAPCARHLPATLPGGGVRRVGAAGGAGGYLIGEAATPVPEREQDAGSAAPGGSTARAPLRGGTLAARKPAPRPAPRAPAALPSRCGRRRGLRAARGSGLPALRRPSAGSAVGPPSRRRSVLPPGRPGPGAPGTTRGAEGPGRTGQGARGAHRGAGP